MVMGMLSDLVKKYPEDLIRTQHDNISAYGDFSFHMEIIFYEIRYERDFVNMKTNLRHRFSRSGDLKMKPGELQTADYCNILPDKPMAEEQLKIINTFDAVTGYFEGSESNTNPNGNGKAFYRPISQFAKDMESLLEQSRNNRFTITFEDFENFTITASTTGTATELPNCW